MAKAQQGDTVRVHYTGTLEDGTVFDSSLGRDPLEFTLGGGEVIPGFEEAVVGLEPGESRTVTVPAEQAYGPFREDLVACFGRDEFPEDMQPEVGQHLQLQGPDEQVIVVTVTDVTPEAVTLDANHPLAGKDLSFTVELQ